MYITGTLDQIMLKSVANLLRNGIRAMRRYDSLAWQGPEDFARQFERMTLEQLIDHFALDIAA